MIIIKKVVYYSDTNSLEVTWADRVQLPDVTVPESPRIPATFGEQGEKLTEAIEAIPEHTVPGSVQYIPVRCHSYSQDQMGDFLRDSGKDGEKYLDIVAVVESRRPYE